VASVSVSVAIHVQLSVWHANFTCDLIPSQLQPFEVTIYVLIVYCYYYGNLFLGLQPDRILSKNIRIRIWILMDMDIRIRIFSDTDTDIFFDIYGYGYGMEFGTG
jgi:hypothetical protein